MKDDTRFMALLNLTLKVSLYCLHFENNMLFTQEQKHQSGTVKLSIKVFK
jgi:hypothetical protein